MTNVLILCAFSRIFTFAEFFLDFFMSWFPFFFETKIIFLLWLVHSNFSGERASWWYLCSTFVPVSKYFCTSKLFVDAVTSPFYCVQSIEIRAWQLVVIIHFFPFKHFSCNFVCASFIDALLCIFGTLQAQHLCMTISLMKCSGIMKSTSIILLLCASLRSLSLPPPLYFCEMRVCVTSMTHSLSDSSLFLSLPLSRLPPPLYKRTCTQACTFCMIIKA
jgi:hypothetical protein